MPQPKLSAAALADLYHQVFEQDKRGAAIFDDLVQRFSKPAVVEGGIDAVIKTFHGMGEHAVIQHIIRQINLANTDERQSTIDIPPN